MEDTPHPNVRVLKHHVERSWLRRLQRLRKSESYPRHPERTYPQSGSARSGHKESEWEKFLAISRRQEKHIDDAIDASKKRVTDTDALLAELDDLLGTTQDELREATRQSSMESSVYLPECDDPISPPGEPFGQLRDQSIAQPLHTSYPLAEEHETLVQQQDRVRAFRSQSTPRKRSPLADFEWSP